MKHLSLAKLPKHRGQSSGVEEIFHKVTPGRLHINQARHSYPQSIEVIQTERHVHTTRERDKVNHGVRGSPDGGIGTYCILECVARKNARHTQMFPNHLHDPTTGKLSESIPAGIDGWNCRVARQAHAEGFYHASHG